MLNRNIISVHRSMLNRCSVKQVIRSVILLCLLILSNVNLSSSKKSSPDELKKCIRMLEDNGVSILRKGSIISKCETYGCVKVAAQLVNHIDNSVDPCENFYKFANGQFIKDTAEDTADDESNSLYGVVTELVSKKVRSLLSEPSKPDERRPFRLVKDYYKSCVSQKDFLKRGNQELASIVNALGGWPVVEGKLWSGRKFDLVEVIRIVGELGFDTDVIFGVDIEINPKNSTERMLSVLSGNYGSDEIDEERKYRVLMQRIVALFAKTGDEKVKARIQYEMDHVLAFEKKLIKISYYDDENSVDELDDFEDNFVESNDDDEDYEEDLDYEEGREEYIEDDVYDGNDSNGDEYDDDNDNDDDSGDDEDVEGDDDEDIDFNADARTIEQMQQSYPFLNWLNYFRAILPTELNITTNDLVKNSLPKFFAKLGEVLRVTSKRTLSNYIIWRVVYEALNMELKTMGKARRDHCVRLTSEKYVRAKIQTLNTTSKCALKLKQFPVPVGLLYSEKYFDEKSKQAVTTLVEDVRHAFIVALSNVKWMDAETREKAIEKAENMIAHVGYPDELRKVNGSLEHYYQDLEITPANYLANTLAHNVFTVKNYYAYLRKAAARSAWENLLDLDPTVANAFYVPSQNVMQFPIAILHELFFSVDRPHYVNYATLGNTIGHEITHGFDDTGRTYDLNGNMKNWWKSSTKRKFTRRAKCFINQYNQFTDETTNLEINGESTLNENMADNGGTRAAYYAYQNLTQRIGHEKKIPGAKYTQNQLFWLTYAQTESSVYGEARLKEIVETDVHAPSEFRVNGVVSNIEEFANDFDCAVGTKMNPLKKCKVW